jgi:hypothetical protein
VGFVALHATLAAPQERPRLGWQNPKMTRGIQTNRYRKTADKAHYSLAIYVILLAGDIVREEVGEHSEQGQSGDAVRGQHPCAAAGKVLCCWGL